MAAAKHSNGQSQLEAIRFHGMGLWELVTCPTLLPCGGPCENGIIPTFLFFFFEETIARLMAIMTLIRGDRMDDFHSGFF